MMSRYLVKEIIDLAKEYGRYGYRMITGLLKMGRLAILIINVLNGFGDGKD